MSLDLAKVIYPLGKCKHDRNQTRWCEGCNLHSAAEVGNLQSVRDLLNANADVNYLVDKGTLGVGHGTPLHFAAQFDDRFTDEAKVCEVVELCFRYGANPNLQNRKGQIPLHLAVANGHVSLVQLLLENNSQPRCRHIEGNTPLHTVAISDIAKCRTHREKIARMLLEYGASLVLRNRDGQKPLDCARANNHSGLISLFMNPPATRKVASQVVQKVVEQSKGMATVRRVICPSCRTEGTIPDKFADKMLRCKKCGDFFIATSCTASS